MNTFHGCDAVKRLKENEILITNENFIVNGEINKSDIIQNLSFHKKNSNILGFPLRLHIYNLAKPNKDFSNSVGINNWLKNTGEAPEILDSLKIDKTKINLERYYFTKGWFDRNVVYEVKKYRKQRAILKYSISTGKPYKIGDIKTEISSKILDSLYKRSNKNSYIKKNNQFDISNFENERKRINNIFRNSGIYHFSQDYITFENDTIGKKNTVDIKIDIPNKLIRAGDTLLQRPFKAYKIKEVNIFTDSNNKNIVDLNSTNITKYNGFNFYNYEKLNYNPKSIINAIQITKGNLFSDLDKTNTYRYLNALNTFKYPNIEYIENDIDNSLITNIYLTPKKRYGLGFNFNVSQSNIQKIGLSFSSGLIIRNIFKGAETLQISALGAVGASRDGSKTEDRFFDINELGADIKLNIPRLFFPLNTEKIIPKYMLPTTQLGMGFTGQKNIGLDKQTFNGRLSYSWSPKKNRTTNFDLLNLQYVRNLNPGNYFNVYQNSFNRLETIALDTYPTPSDYLTQNSLGEEILDINNADDFISLVSNDSNFQFSNPDDFQSVRNIRERKNRLTQDNFILASNLNLIKDNRESAFDNDFSIFRFKLELAGNLLNSVSDLVGFDKNENGEFEINNVAFSQYAKSEIDYIKLWNLGRNNVIALRTFIGVAIPIGNSNTIPFSKSFFAGGSNDNRAWTAYNLGPGRSDNNNEFNEANFKLAFSLEHRYKLFSKLDGAFFIDAGNIWNVLDDVEDPKAIFNSLKSLNDIAVGSGIGLRYDFDFFILRFDIGFKTYNPTYPKNQRWLKDFNFSNAVYNIGINYPF